MIRRRLGDAASLNIGDGPNPVKIQGIVHLIVMGVTLIGMQEGSDRAPMLSQLLELLKHPAAVARRTNAVRHDRRVTRRRLRAAGWRVYQPTVPGGRAVPIAYDSRVWRLRRTRSLLAVARMWVGAMGAGPTWAKPKVINLAVLVHRETGEVVEHLNTHMIPSADRENLSPREKAARLNHYERQAEALTAAVRRAERRGHGVVVTLDANATRMSRLVDPLREAELVGWTVNGTHGHRGIDHVLTVRHGRVVGQPAAVIFLPGFDHRAVIRGLWVRDGGDR